MKIIVIGDTHNRHKGLVDMPEGDMIIHVGDVSGRGYHHEVENFCKWYAELPYKYKILVAGNHDFYFQHNSPMMISAQLPGKICVNPTVVSENSIIYLNDSGIEIEGIKIWGSPISPTFYNWAFMADRGEKIAKHWAMIPNGQDIIITHGPPKGILDKCVRDGFNAGCEELLKYIKKLKPKYHLFGHIHEGHGMITKGKTTYINASVLNEDYGLVFNPHEIEI